MQNNYNSLIGHQTQDKIYKLTINRTKFDKFFTLLFKVEHKSDKLRKNVLFFLKLLYRPIISGFGGFCR